jgi:hypothetical protein
MQRRVRFGTYTADKQNAAGYSLALKAAIYDSKIKVVKTVK